MKQNKGFTLIELLVVVAIIGILASVVLASLNSARGKGTDSAIKGELSSVRAQAEIYYDTNGDYGTAMTAGDCSSATTAAGEMFSDDAVVKKLWTSVDNRNGGTTANTRCASSVSAWAVASDLTQGGAWCVDSTGASQSKDISGTAYADAASALSGTACN